LIEWFVYVDDVSVSEVILLLSTSGFASESPSKLDSLDSSHHITLSTRMQAYWPLYPMNSLMYIKSIVPHSLKLQYYGFVNTDTVLHKEWTVSQNQ